MKHLFSSIRRSRHQFILERGLTSSYLVFEGLALWNSVWSGAERFYITFSAIRFGFALLAVILSAVRKRTYIPSLSEMPDQTYWRFTLMIILAMKMLLLEKFTHLSPWALLVDLIIGAFLLTSLAIAFQSQGWTQEDLAKNRKRIKTLCKKAGLSKKELETITPDLIAKAEKERHTPVLWSVTRVFLTIVLGASLGSIAEAIVDLLAKVGLRLQNLAPPF